jgi:exodeoxyribonuclease-3
MQVARVFVYSVAMRIVSWNVNGIRAIHRNGHWDTFLKELKPDIFCLQETKAAPEQIDKALIEAKGYTAYFAASTGRKGYSGVAIYSKEEALDVKVGFPASIQKKYALSDSFGDLNTEGRVIAAEFQKFYLVNVYTPNAKPDLARLTMRHKLWDPAFLAYVKSLEAKKPVIFCGDLNVAHTPDDLANPKANEGEHGYTKEEREGIDQIIKAGFVDTFRLFTQGKGHYTWWSHFGNARKNNTGWRIDYFFVSKALAKKIKKAEIFPAIEGSDHCPISIEL